MKKRVLMLASALVLAAGSLYAQSVSGGLKAGVNFANQNWEDASGVDFKSRTGFHAGAFATINFGTIGIQPEIIYNSVGSKAETAIGDLTTKLDYVTIPIMVRVNFAKVFNIHAGPQFGILTSAKQEFGGDKEDIKDELKSSDLGLGVGAGLDLPMGLVASVRYNIGLSDIGDSDAISGAIKNNVLQISLGYNLFGK